MVTIHHQGVYNGVNLAIDPEDEVARYSKRNIMHYQLFGGLQQQVPRVDTLAVYVQISLQDSNDNLVIYIDTESIVVSNLSALNDYLDDIESGEVIDDTTFRDATYSFTKKNVTRNEQDLEMITIRDQGVYNGVNLAVSKTLLAPEDSWRLITDTDGYPIHKGDHFDFLWIILRPIS